VVYDKWLQSEFFKHEVDLLVGPIASIFSDVDCFGFHPSGFKHIIHPIHKSGDILDQNNYQTTMIKVPLPNLM